MSIKYQLSRITNDWPIRGFDTHSDEAGQEVCDYIVSHESCAQHQLLGLIITRQLTQRDTLRIISSS